MFAWLSLMTVLLGMALHVSGTDVADVPVAWPVIPALFVCWLAMLLRLRRIRRQAGHGWLVWLLGAAPVGVLGFVALLAVMLVVAIASHDGSSAATDRVGRAALVFAASIPMVFFAFIEPRRRPPA
jgi:hypothetical protein